MAQGSATRGMDSSWIMGALQPVGEDGGPGMCPHDTLAGKSGRNHNTTGIIPYPLSPPSLIWYTDIVNLEGKACCHYGHLLVAKATDCLGPCNSSDTQAAYHVPQDGLKSVCRLIKKRENKDKHTYYWISSSDKKNTPCKSFRCICIASGLERMLPKL
ncbi:hypothetical protein KOW79_016827 [Hemibagrus wyckioides]|uniref:Uncharacterized protein n=1 Tax=Hemibagrus wyckioides TaxID=337641 RepID=A0A9D3SHW8_9TELE|nr:hypothetical protein KOW79_016827 [Hemibagrus wyckioides]